MGVEKKMDLSNAGQLLVSTLKLIDSLVPNIVHEVDPDYSTLPHDQQLKVEERARNIATTVLVGIMTP